MAKSNKNVVPEAMDSLERFKYEVASEEGVYSLLNLKMAKISTFDIRQS